MFSLQFVIFVHNVSLVSALSISTSSSVPKMADFGMYTLLCVILSMGMFNSLAYLWLILWSTAEGMSSDGRSSLAVNSYMHSGLNSVGACTVIIDMTLGCK